MIIFLHGEDSFRSLQRLKQLKDSFVQKYDKSGINVERLDQDKLDFADFQKAMVATGFLAKRKLVIIKNLLSGKQNKETAKQIIDYLPDKAEKDDNIIIFWEGQEIKKSAGLKRLQKLAKEAKNYSWLSGAELTRWIRAEVKKQKGKISTAAVTALQNRVSSNLWQMKNEIDKLVSYKGKQEISEKDVSLFVRSKFDDNVFHLTDALGQKQAKMALKLISDQLELGNNARSLLATLSWQFRNLLLIQEQVELGNNNNYQIASELSLHPFVVKNSLNQLRHYDQQELKAIFQKLLDLDFKLKTSRADPQTLLDLLVAEVCS